MKTAVIVMLSAGLAGCVTSAAQNQTIAVDYRKLSDCVYLKLSPIIGPGLNKADVATEGVSRISLESGGVRYWDLVIMGAGKGQSRVEFTPGRNMWGSDAGSARDVWPTVQACSS